ncbi:hypothetical protein [Alloactinosynnema sp. L-07]|nr:hypothetical protein [Alloactinosynnema sp. L-07]
MPPPTEGRRDRIHENGTWADDPEVVPLATELIELKAWLGERPTE